MFENAYYIYIHFPTYEFQNKWDRSNINGDPLPGGTDYYSLDLGSVAPPIRGYMAIVR